MAELQYIKLQGKLLKPFHSVILPCRSPGIPFALRPVSDKLRSVIAMSGCQILSIGESPRDLYYSSPVFRLFFTGNQTAKLPYPPPRGRRYRSRDRQFTSTL
jgi:hypothetical protein